MDLEAIYRSLYLIRRAEEEVVRIYPSDKIKSPVHLSIGQEAISVGLGDGATEEGVFHESLNFAALKKLPAIFICENNLLAIYTYQHQRQHVAEITGIVRAHGIPTTRIEHSETAAIHAGVTNAAAAIRAGMSGPFFIECMTCRWKEHETRRLLIKGRSNQPKRGRPS